MFLAMFYATLVTHDVPNYPYGNLRPVQPIPPILPILPL